MNYHLDMLNLTTNAVGNDSGGNVSAYSLHLQLGPLTICVSLILLTLAILIGNTLVLIVFIREKKLRKRRINWFLFSLATADLLIGIFVLPPTIVYRITGSWYFNSILCRLFLTLDVWLCTASILSICSVGIDRFFSLRDPTGYAHRYTNNTVRSVVVSMWSFAFVVASPSLLLADGITATQCNLSQNAIFASFATVSSFILPVTIVSFVYTTMYILNRRRSRSIRRKISRRHDAISRTLTPPSPGRRVPTFVDSPRSPRRKKKMEVKHSRSYSYNYSKRNNTIRRIKRARPGAPKPPAPPTVKLTMAAEDVVEREEFVDMKSSSLDYGLDSPMPIRKLSFLESQRSLDDNDNETTIRFGEEAAPGLYENQIESTFAFQPRKTSYTASLSSGGGDSGEASSPPPPQRLQLLNPNHNLVMNIGGGGSQCSSTRSTPRSSVSSFDSSPVVENTADICRTYSSRITTLRRREMKSAGFLSCIVVALVLCWSPFFLVFILRACGIRVVQVIFDACIYIGYVNSALNPIIYNYSRRDFRKAMVVVLCRQHDRRKRTKTSSSVIPPTSTAAIAAAAIGAKYNSSLSLYSTHV